MQENKEGMHITLDDTTLGNLRALRQNDESFSELVARLAADQIKERLAHGDAVFHVKLVPELREAVDKVRHDDETHTSAIIRIIKSFQQAEDVRVGMGTFGLWQKLDGIREKDERYADVILRLLDEHIVAVRSYTVYLTKSMQNDLSVIRDGDESMLSAIERLIKEHKVTEAQQAMTPLGSTKIMRVKPTTCARIESMVQDGEDYDMVVTRLLDERYLYRKIANGMAEEGQRLLHNRASIIYNFKLVIRELVAIDAVTAREDDSIVRQDVDELMADMMSTLLDEGDSE